MRKDLLFRGALLLLFASPVQAEWKFRSEAKWHWVASPPAAFSPQVGIPRSGGGGSASVTLVSGTTPITGGADKQVCFNDAATLSCGDAGMVYDKTTDKLTLAGSLVVPTGNTPSATTINGGTPGTGILFFDASTTSIISGGAYKFSVDGTTANFSVDLVPNASGARSVGTTALPFLDAQYTGWAKQTAGEIALNADYTNATAAFVVTPLSVTLTSGRTYNFTLSLTFADSTAADGAKFDFAGGAATITNFRAHCAAFDAAGASLVETNGATTAIGTAVSVALALTTQANIVCEGTIVTSSTNTFIVRAGQTAHSTGTLTIHRGSWLSVRDSRPL